MLVNGSTRLETLVGSSAHTYASHSDKAQNGGAFLDQSPSTLQATSTSIPWPDREKASELLNARFDQEVKVEEVGEAQEFSCELCSWSHPDKSQEYICLLCLRSLIRRTAEVEVEKNAFEKHLKRRCTSVQQARAGYDVDGQDSDRGRHFFAQYWQKKRDTETDESQDSIQSDEDVKTTSTPAPAPSILTQSAQDKLRQLLRSQKVSFQLLENPLWREFMSHLAPELSLPAADKIAVELARTADDVRVKLAKRLRNASTSIHISDAHLSSAADGVKMSAVTVSWIDAEFRWNSIVSEFKHWPVADISVIISNLVLDVLGRTSSTGSLATRTTVDDDTNMVAGNNIFEAAAQNFSQDNVLLQLSPRKLGEKANSHNLRTAENKQIRCVAQAIDSLVTTLLNELRKAARPARAVTAAQNNATQTNNTPQAQTQGQVAPKAATAPTVKPSTPAKAKTKEKTWPSAIWMDGPQDSDRVDAEAQAVEEKMRNALQSQNVMSNLRVDASLSSLQITPTGDEQQNNIEKELDALRLWDKIRIVTRKANASPALNDLLREELGRRRSKRLDKFHVLEYDSKRWDSFANVVARLMSLRDPVHAFTVQLRAKWRSTTSDQLRGDYLCPILSEDDWASLTRLSSLLEIVRFAVTQFYEDGAHIHKVLPTLQALLSTLDSHEKTENKQGSQLYAPLQSAKKVLVAHFKKQAKIDAVCLSYVLRPDRRLESLKTLLHSEVASPWGPARYQEVESSLRDYLKVDETPNELDGKVGAERPVLNPMMIALDTEYGRLREIQNEREAKLAYKVEILWLEDRGLDPPNSKEAEEPLRYWKSVKDEYPRLARLARGVYGASATSVRAERVLAAARKAYPEVAATEDSTAVENRVVLMHWLASKIPDVSDNEPVRFAPAVQV